MPAQTAWVPARRGYLKPPAGLLLPCSDLWISRHVGVMSEGTSQASVVEEFIENACVALAEIGGAVTTIDGMTTQIASAAEEQHAGVRSLQGMVATRGARGAALEQALADLIRIADALEAANAQPV